MEILQIYEQHYCFRAVIKKNETNKLVNKFWDHKNLINDNHNNNNNHKDSP